MGNGQFEDFVGTLHATSPRNYYFLNGFYLDDSRGRKIVPSGLNILLLHTYFPLSEGFENGQSDTQL